VNSLRVRFFGKGRKMNTQFQRDEKPQDYSLALRTRQRPRPGGRGEVRGGIKSKMRVNSHSLSVVWDPAGVTHWIFFLAHFFPTFGTKTPNNGMERTWLGSGKFWDFRKGVE